MSEEIAKLIVEINSRNSIDDLDCCDSELKELINKYKNYQK